MKKFILVSTLLAYSVSAFGMFGTGGMSWTPTGSGGHVTISVPGHGTVKGPFPSGGHITGGSPGATPYSMPGGPSAPGGYGGSYGGGSGSGGGTVLGGGSSIPQPAAFYPGNFGSQIPLKPIPPRNFLGGRQDPNSKTIDYYPTPEDIKMYDKDDAKIRRCNDEIIRQNRTNSERNWLSSDEYKQKCQQQRIAHEKAKAARLPSDQAQAKSFASQAVPKFQNALALRDKKVISDVQGRVASDIDKSFHAQAAQLNGEFSKWTSLDDNKKSAIALTDRYADTVKRFDNNAGSINKDVYPYAEAVLQEGLNNLSEGVAIAGGAPGDFASSTEDASWMLEAGKAFLDVGLSATPGVSVGKDLYEAYSGKSVIDGSDLHYTDRAFAVLGVMTAGGSDGIVAAAKGLNKLGHVLHNSGLVAKGLNKAKKIIGSASDFKSSLTLASGKKLPGTGVASKVMKDPATMLRGTHQSAGWVPKEVGDKMVGKTYKNWDHFREEFWKEMSNSKYASEFSHDSGNIARMQNGNAPFAHPNQHVITKGSPIKHYDLHHAYPVQHGGDVYDVSNIMITTKKFHGEVLDPKFHYGRKK